MKKLLAITTASAMLLANLAGCSNDSTSNTSEGKLQVVTTSFPVYSWVSEIAGDLVDISYLLDSGIDLHNYQPSVADIVNIKESDLFVYVGGHSDEWVDDLLDQTSNPFSLFEALDGHLVYEEVVEGMTEGSHDDHDHGHDEEDHDHDEEDHGHDEEDHDHDHDEEDHDHDEEDHDHDHDEEDHDHDEEDHDHDEEDHDHDHDEEDDDHATGYHTHDEFDEHVWMSLTNAVISVSALTEQLVSIDPSNADTYNSNSSAYIEKLEALDADFIDYLSSQDDKYIVVADRFALRYLVDDYDIQYSAAFAGCTSEYEVSFETITFLTQKVDELGLDKLVVIEGSDGDIGSTVLNETNATELVQINSIQSVSKADIEGGATYLDMMTTNLEAFKTLFN